MSYLGEGGLRDIRKRVYRERGSVTLGSDGRGAVTFLNPIAATEDSHIQLTAWVTSGEDPVVVNPLSWVESGGLRTGVLVEAARLRELPLVLTLLSALIGFRVWQNTTASGVKVDWMLY